MTIFMRWPRRPPGVSAHASPEMASSLSVMTISTPIGTLYLEIGRSDGAQPDVVNIQFQKKVKLQLVVLYVDFKLDESYTPSKISIRAGDGFHNLKEIKAVELVKPTGWVYISLSGSDPRNILEKRLVRYIEIKHGHMSICTWQGNICEYFHVANSSFVKSS